MNNYSKAGSTALTLDQLRHKAPSVFAERPREGMSSRYSFIPTVQAVTALMAAGWNPVYAAQSKARTEGGEEYAKHILRFRREASINREALSIGDILPELVLVNSHDGSSSYDLSVGLFRLVCGNGLMVSDATIAHFRVRHTGYTDAKVIDAAETVVSNTPKALEAVEGMRTLQLMPGERLAFAEAAMGLRWETGEAPVKPEALLQVRRMGDQAADLWTTMNVVQENMLRGGIRGRSAESRRRTTTREVKSVNENVRLNRALWTLADHMKDLKSAPAIVAA